MMKFVKTLASTLALSAALGTVAHADEIKREPISNFPISAAVVIPPYQRLIFILAAQFLQKKAIAMAIPNNKPSMY